MAAGDCTATRGNYSDYPCNVFDGVDDYVEIAHDARQLGANLSQGFTISAWINARSVGETEGNILDKSTGGTSGQAGFHFKVIATSKVAFRLNNGTTTSSGNNSITYGTWAHVLVTINSAQLSNFWINGINVGTINGDLVQTISTITSNSPMRIGNNAQATTRTFDGSIRSVKMWNRVLSTTEITADYAGRNSPTDGLIHNFKLGGDYADYGIVGVTATNSGSVANNTIPNKIVTDTSQINLAAATGKLIAVPMSNRDARVTMLGVNRA